MDNCGVGYCYYCPYYRAGGNDAGPNQRECKINDKKQEGN